MGLEIPKLDITLLGQFAVRHGGKALDITSRPAQVLLAYLLLTAGSRHRREKLAALLWPDADEENARQNLRNALWRLNKILGAGYVLADKISVGMNPDARYDLDTAVLEAQGSDAMDALVASISAYKGELLPGFYEEWVLLERERLRAVFERKMERLLARLAEEARWKDVVQWAERWIALGQAPEAAYRAAMRAHASLGDTAGMAAVYRRCVKALEDDLGLEPSPETQALYQRCSKGEAPTRNRQTAVESRDDTERPHPSVPAFLEQVPGEMKTRPKIVGREEELARLQHLLASALAGHGRVAFVTGEAGQGKTSLLSEFTRRAQEAHPELVIALGSCNAYTGLGDPFLPFRDVLGMLAGDVEARWLAGAISRDQALRLWNLVPSTLEALLDQGPELLGSLVSGDALAKRVAALMGDTGMDELRTQLARVSATVGGQSPDKSRLFDAYTRVLQALAQRWPLMLVLDDLHWADTSSIGLLFHLGRRLGGSRILLIGAFRPEDVSEDRAGAPHPLRQVVSEFTRDFGDIRVDLDRSTSERAFIDSLLDREPNRLRRTFRERLAGLTEGNALFAVELLRELKDRGGLRRDDEGFWAEGPELAWETLPARVEGVIRTRLERIDSSLREALTVGSLQGTIFAAEVVAHVLDTDARQLIRRFSGELDRHHHLIEGQELQRVAGQRLSQYRFRHSLFQQYLYNSLSRMDRAILHEEVGNALETLYGAQAGDMAVELARHFREAGLEEKAVHYLLLAGKGAARLSAHEEALLHLRQGLELLAALPQTPETRKAELELLLLSGASLQALRGYADTDVSSIYERARELAENVGDTRQIFTALWSLSLFHTQHGRFAKARELGEAMLALARREGDEGLLLQAHHSLWFATLCTGELALAREHAEQGIALYDPAEHRDHALRYGGHDPGVCARLFAARALWYLGYPDQALARSREALALAERLTHPNSLAHAFAHSAEVHLLRREGRQAQELAERTVRLAEAKGFAHWRAWGTVLRGAALAEQGQLASGIEEMHRGLADGEALGTIEKLVSLARLAQAYARLGQVAQGQRVLAEAFAAAERLGGDRWYDAELYRLQGELLRLQEGTLEEAQRCFNDAIATARRQGARALELRAAMNLCWVCAQRGDMDEALPVLKDVYNWFTEGTDTADLIDAKAFLTASQ